MTTRTKLYIRNAKGKRIHLIIFKGLNGEQHDRMGQQVNAMNEGINKGKAGPIVGIAVPNNVTYQVIKL